MNTENTSAISASAHTPAGEAAKAVEHRTAQASADSYRSPAAIVQRIAWFYFAIAGFIKIWVLHQFWDAFTYVGLIDFQRSPVLPIISTVLCLAIPLLILLRKKFVAPLMIVDLAWSAFESYVRIGIDNFDLRIYAFWAIELAIIFLWIRFHGKPR